MHGGNRESCVNILTDVCEGVTGFLIVISDEMVVC